VSDHWLIVGLGNPGPAYAMTRHNIGAMVVDVVASSCSAKLGRHKRALADAAEVQLGMPGRINRAVLSIPLSFMNESGGPVKALIDFYDIAPERLIVIHDELDLPFGGLRIKFGGGDNGHNGLKSIRKSLGTGDFFRVRAGIGRPMGRQSPADYVLQVFSGSERTELPGFLDRCARAVECVIEDGLETAQNRFNAAPETSGETQ
jgi:peptidyl-tRNA hydrolase, PTH1 family